MVGKHKKAKSLDVLYHLHIHDKGLDETIPVTATYSSREIAIKHLPMEAWHHIVVACCHASGDEFQDWYWSHIKKDEMLMNDLPFLSKIDREDVIEFFVTGKNAPVVYFYFTKTILDSLSAPMVHNLEHPGERLFRKKLPDLYNPSYKKKKKQENKERQFLANASAKKQKTSEW